MVYGTGVRLDTGFRGVLSCAGAAGGAGEEGEEGDVVDSLGRLCLVMRRRSVAEEGGIMTDEAVTRMMMIRRCAEWLGYNDSYACCVN
jgi:hypothetical protein